MAISGSLMNGAATRQPMQAKPAPVERHGQKQVPDTAWSAPPAGMGSGAPWAEAEVLQMTGRGLVLDLGHGRGHEATPAVRRARIPYVVGHALVPRVDATAQAEGAAQDAAAAAHGDCPSGYYKGHQYAPMPQTFAGESYVVERQNTGAIPATGARAAIHGRPGGQHVDGSAGEFAPTGFPIGEAGRWARANYSSPTLGAMYSRNSLRGVLPQTHTVPTAQPALSGPRESGIPANSRFVLPRFTTPSLFRSPPSESDRLMAGQSADAGGSTMGVGF